MFSYWRRDISWNFLDDPMHSSEKHGIWPTLESAVRPLITLSIPWNSSSAIHTSSKSRHGSIGSKGSPLPPLPRIPNEIGEKIHIFVYFNAILVVKTMFIYQILDSLRRQVMDPGMFLKCSVIKNDGKYIRIRNSLNFQAHYHHYVSSTKRPAYFWTVQTSISTQKCNQKRGWG